MADKQTTKEEPETVEGEVVEVQSSELALGVDTVTRAEIDMQIATAHRFPRTISAVKREIMDLATIDEETADLCFYSLPRGGKSILGPSIRLAEIALYSFGNARAGTRVLGESEDGRFIRVLGVCHDLQKNVAIAQEVTRRITKKDGKRFDDDMIGVTIAAASSIALRNAIFRVVPQALIRPAYKQCLAIVQGDAKSLGERRATVIARLQKLSQEITVEKILHRCGVKLVEEITGEHILDLVGAGTAIKDGVASIEAYFPSAPTKASVPDLESPEGQAAAQAELAGVKPAGEKVPEPPKDAKPKGEKAASAEPPTVTALVEATKVKGIPPKAVEEYLMTKWGLEGIEDLSPEQAQEMSKWITGWKAGS